MQVYNPLNTKVNTHIYFILTINTIFQIFLFDFDK